MNHVQPSLAQLGGTSRRLTSRVLAILENRLELLTLEVQEERDRLIYAVLLALGLATFGLLAIMALSAVVVVALWKFSPVAALLMLVLLHAGLAGWMYARLHRLRRDWETLPATLEQLRKDRQCVEQLLH